MQFLFVYFLTGLKVFAFIKIKKDIAVIVERYEEEKRLERAKISTDEPPEVVPIPSPVPEPIPDKKGEILQPELQRNRWGFMQPVLHFLSSGKQPTKVGSSPNRSEDNGERRPQCLTMDAPSKPGSPRPELKTAPGQGAILREKAKETKREKSRNKASRKKWKASADWRN